MHQTLLNFCTTNVLDVKGDVVLEKSLKGPLLLFREKNVVPAAKRWLADLLDFAVPEVVDVASGKKMFKTAAKSVGRQTLRSQPGGGRPKRSIPVKNLKRSSRSRGDIFAIIAN